MNKICFIIPYFGNFPPYFQLFLWSCEKNPNIDFLFFSDNSKEDLRYDIPPNCRFHLMSFREMQALIQTRINGARVPQPYKLCDYKPCFGHIFKKYLTSYSYWGHCDIDTILGNVEGFLQKIEYWKYDRIFEYGHLVCYKNCDEINCMYLTSIPRHICVHDFSFVKKTSYCCHFDECGSNFIFSYFEKQFYKKTLAFDVSPYFDTLRAGDTPMDARCLATYEDGHIYSYELLPDTEELIKKEYMYIHLQKRTMPRPSDSLLSHKTKFIIHQSGFIPLSQAVTPDLVKSLTPEKAIRRHYPVGCPPRSAFSKVINILRQDVPVRGIMALHTIIAVWRNMRWLQKHSPADFHTTCDYFNGNKTISSDPCKI